jgi:hypothetical protein
VRLLRTALLLVPWPALLGMAVAFAGVEVAVLANQSGVLRSWASVVEAVNGSWLVLSILVVGCAAAVSVRPWQNRELTAALPDSGARTVAAVGVVVGLVAATVHALTVLVAVVWGWTAALPGQPRLWPVLSVLVGLWACGVVGTAVARSGAGSLSPLLAMGLWVGVLYVARAVGGRELIDLGGVSVVLVGLAPDTGTVLWRAGWLLAAGAIAWSLAAHGRRALRRPVFLALVPVTVALALVTVTLADRGFVRTPVVWACESGPPKVCVSAEYEDRLDDYASAITRMAPLAEQVGLPQPGNGYRQTVGVRPGPGSFNVDRDVNPVQLAFDLVQFALPCSVDWDERQLQTADVVAAWILSETGIPLPPGSPPVPSLGEAQGALASLRCDG